MQAEDAELRKRKIRGNNTGERKKELPVLKMNTGNKHYRAIGLASKRTAGGMNHRGCRAYQLIM